MTVKEFANEIGYPLTSLLNKLTEAGLNKGIDDVLSQEDKDKLQSFLTSENKPKKL